MDVAEVSSGGRVLARFETCAHDVDDSESDELLRVLEEKPEL
jgi:hypothetical protein